jgi:hypothetical protein
VHTMQMALGRDRRGADVSHTRGLPIFKKRAVRKGTRSSLTLSRFLLLLVRTLTRCCGRTLLINEVLW